MTVLGILGIFAIAAVLTHFTMPRKDPKYTGPR